jgi:geranyl-CoA carboxylase alpha subunit
VIAHGATREEARGRLIVGLEQLTGFGVTTNQAFLMSCLRHPGFAKGEATTAFIGAHRDELLAPRADAAFDMALAGLLLYVTNPQAPAWRRGRSLAATFPLPAKIEIAGQAYELEVWRERDGSYTVTMDGRQDKFEIDQLDFDAIRFRHDGVMDSAKFLRDGDRLHLQRRGIPLAATDLTLAAPKAAASNGGDGKVRAAMNGRVVAVLVKPGDRVTADQPVMTLEAMKMEHVHKAGIDGVVAAIDVAEGEQVTTGKIVAEIGAG